MKKAILTSNFTVFFSLPFYPIIKKNIFFNGHLALGLGDMVYQIYNPALLESNFFVSKMPIEDWLYNDSYEWANMNKKSKEYTYVHLYKRAETKRTATYYLTLKNIDNNKIKKYKSYFDNLENKFQKNEIKFHLISYNCATIINNLIYSENWLKKGGFDFLPSVIFKRLVKALHKNKLKFELGKVESNKLKLFIIHNLCYGICSLNCENHMDKWIKKYMK